MGNNSKARNFIMHGGILAAAGIIVRIIGMLYRIPMVNIIGSEGNGLYSVAFNVYNIMLVLSSYGLPMAVSKLVSARFAVKEYKNAYRVFRSSLLISVITGGTAALLVYFGADLLEATLYSGYSGIAIPLKILAPTIFIVAVLGVLRGFYQGQGTMIPTAISQLLEQVVNAFVSVFAAYMLMNTYRQTANAAAFGAAGGTLGTAVGALFALLFLVFVYLLYKPSFDRLKRRDKTSDLKPYQDVYKMIVITMIPIILGQTFYQISAMIDDIMFGNIMMSMGIADSAIKMDIGNFGSSYVILIGLPQGVASAMSASMLPSIVSSYTQRCFSQIRGKITVTLKANMFIAIPCFVGLMVLGQPIIQLLFPSYDSTQGAMMLKIGAIAVVFYTLSTVTSSALQGIDKMSTPVKHSCIALAVHMIIVFLLLKYTDLGIYALVIGNATFPVLIFVLNLVALKKIIRYRIELPKTFGIPLVCSLAMGFVTSLAYNFFMDITKKNTVALSVALCAALITYFVPIIILKRKSIY